MMVDVRKEKEPVGGERQQVKDLPPVAESPRKQEKNLEVESWVTKIEKRMARIPKGAPGAQDDQVVVQQPASGQPSVKLPLTQQTMSKGQRAPVQLSIRWLVTWAIRQIKMMARLGRKVELEKLPVVAEEKAGEQKKEK